MANATVREWHDDLGWGVLDSPETPGGCWTHFSVVDTPYLGSVDGAEVSEYKGLSTGEEVEFEWETPGQDGFDYRAVVVRHIGADAPREQRHDRTFPTDLQN